MLESAVIESFRHLSESLLKCLADSRLECIGVVDCSHLEQTWWSARPLYSQVVFLVYRKTFTRNMLRDDIFLNVIYIK